MLTCNIHPNVLILGGASLFLTMVSFIIVFIVLYQKRQYKFYIEKQQLEATFLDEIHKIQLETQEETFSQIGEEIHDNIGQLLTSTKILLSITARSLADIPEPFNTAQDTLSKAIQELRALSKSLNKDWLRQFNIIENLSTEIQRINSANLISASLITSLQGLSLTAEDQIVLFRIVQEAIHNCIKHSNAKFVQVVIYLDNGIQIAISDDGSGYNAEPEVATGVGILNMKNRTKVLGGKIRWVQNQAGGTDVEITIPN